MDDDRTTDDASVEPDADGGADSAGAGEGDLAAVAAGSDDGAEYTDLEDRLARYEWLGMLAAGLGFFLTPVFTGPVAGYCAHWAGCGLLCPPDQSVEAGHSDAHRRTRPHDRRLLDARRAVCHPVAHSGGSASAHDCSRGGRQEGVTASSPRAG